jgi:hypothetical protein
MKQRFFLLALALPALCLAGCGPNRAAMDKTLSRACLAGVKSLYDEGDTFDVKKEEFSSEKSPEDSKLRTVRLHVYYTHNGGAIEEKDYACSFEESAGLFGFGSSTRFYRLDLAGEKYGNFDGTVYGDLNDMLKLSTAMKL